jgi:hypothetical protein
MEDGVAGTKFEVFNTVSGAGASAHSPHRTTNSAKRKRSSAMKLLQYQRDFPQVVKKVDFRIQEHMCPDAGLSPDNTPLLQEPLAEPPPDPRRDAAWQAMLKRFARVFEPPDGLPPFLFVNGSCNLKEGCSVPPRAGVGRLSQEEIDYTKAIMTDYVDKGWIRPSYSRTAARLFFVTKKNGTLALRRRLSGSERST